MEQNSSLTVKYINLVVAVWAKLSHDGSLILFLKCYKAIPLKVFDSVAVTLQLVNREGVPKIIRGSIEEAPTEDRSAGWRAFRFVGNREDFADLFVWESPNKSNLEFIFLEQGKAKKQITNRFFLEQG